MGSSQIQHVFVLMLENRSFDHMLGFSGLTGTDASTGVTTKINGLKWHSSRIPSMASRLLFHRAPLTECPLTQDTNSQTCCCNCVGTGATYPPGGPYPAINNSGYVASYVGSGGGSSPGVVMNCYSRYSASRVARLGR